MPFVEDRTTPPRDPNAWIGINVPIVTPGLFCALGLVDVMGLWQSPVLVTPHWRVRRPPVVRAWKPLAPRHKGGF